MIREAKSTFFKGEKERMNFSKKKLGLSSHKQETKVSSHLSSIPVSMFRKVVCTSSDLAEIQHNFMFSPIIYVFKSPAKFDQCRVQSLEFLISIQSEDYPVILSDTDNPFLVTSSYFILLFLMHQKSYNNSTYLVNNILTFGYPGSHCFASLLCSIFQIA